MAIRKIEYTVTAEGISPQTIQPGGVQGEHKATEIVFRIPEELWQNLEEIAEGGSLIYRVDGYNGEGGMYKSDVYALSKEVNYPLEERLTRYGGIIKAVLVISLVKNDKTEMELYSFPAVIRLNNLPEGKDTDGENTESMSTLAQFAKKSAETAVLSADTAVDAKNKTEQARAALENGSLWIFDGGDASGESDIEFVLDDVMSDSSDNAVKNRTVKKYIDEIKTSIETIIGNISSSVNKNAKSINEVLSREADYIVERGTDGMWTYEKWASGKAVCWGKKNYGDIKISNEWGGADKLYESAEFSQSYPTGLFIGMPDTLHIDVMSTDGGAMIERGYGRHDESKTCVFCLVRPSSLTLSQVYMSFYAIGKWKEEEAE